MYKIDSVKIDGFWHRLDASCKFNPDVNIIIGKNGTGKTTFMNILNAVLTVDIPSLAANDFESATIYLIRGKQRRQIKATKIENEQNTLPVLEYQISQRKRRVRLVGIEDRIFSSSVRRRIQEEVIEIRNELESMVSVTSLSVYRLRSDDEYEIRDRHGTRVISPVDYRLSQALRGLTQYQLKLSQKASKVSARLQSDVLASILYSEEDAKDIGYKLHFDKSEEQSRLTSAYAQLNSLTPDIKKRIHFHVNAISEAIEKITGSIDSDDADKSSKTIDIKPLEALRKTHRIIDLSLEAKKETEEIYSQIRKFLQIIKEFITDKEFEFESSGLVIKTAHGVVGHERLSSGEKQLIILMVEALLQDRLPHVFLADEPELSLHIAWQRMVIPAVREINPNAQIIVATHSPEVASKYPDSIFDMESLVNG